jgi:hypothetical protein
MTQFATRTMALAIAKPKGISFSAPRSFTPGKVGSEYHLTRGHYHRKRNYAETYQSLSGRGLVLFEREEVRAERRNSLRARLRTSKPFGHTAPSTPPTYPWYFFGPARLRPVTPAMSQRKPASILRCSTGCCGR